MSRRQVRQPNRRGGRPWRKTPKEDRPYLGREAHRVKVWARFKAEVDGQGDVAALVQVVRDCQAEGLSIPDWIPLALESWLTDFVNLANGKGKGSDHWTRWARHWRRGFLDYVIAGHLTANRDVYGLTWAEAADEAADWFRGTPAAGSPAAMLAAYKRDRKRGPGRAFTHWEDRMSAKSRLDAQPYRPRNWWALNADRMGDERGVWLARPRRVWKKE